MYKAELALLRCAASAGRRFVELESVAAHVVQQLVEAVEVDGLADVAVDAQTVGFDDVLFLVREGQHHNRQELRARVCAQLPQYLEAIDLRQFEVQQDQIG